MIRSGCVPPLADGFTVRPQSAAGLADLAPGTAVALVPAAGAAAASCGKTQLAIRYAENLCRAGQVEVMAWVDASSRASALSGYLQAAAAAGTGTHGPAEQAAARLACWLAGTDRPWLMVLDDLRDPADLDGIWPAGPAGLVLITASDERTVRDGDELRARLIQVGPFSRREALNYITARLTRDRDQRHGALDLAIALDGEPCALAHASAVIATTSGTCRDYQLQYAVACDRLARQQAPGRPLAPAAVTWAISAERAAQLAPGGATEFLLALMALLDGQPVPGPLLTSPAVHAGLGCGTDTCRADHVLQAIEALEDTGLITLDPPPAPWAARMSRTMAAVAMAALPGQLIGQAAQAAAGGLGQIWPQPEPEPPQAAVLRACAAALQRTAPDPMLTGSAFRELWLQAGRSLDVARLTGPAACHWSQLVATSEDVLEPGHAYTLAAASKLAEALLAAGRPVQAAQWWEQIAAQLTRTRGHDHPDTLAARAGAGRALASAGQPRHAVTLLQQVVSGYTRASGPGDPGTLNARDELAAACQLAGRPDEAIDCYQHNLAESEDLHGHLHPVVLSTRDKLGAAFLSAGRPGEAVCCYQQNLAGRRQALGEDHPATITTRRDLAAAYRATGKIAAALQQHEQACAGYERALGATHPHTLACRADLATAYRDVGHLTDAAAVLRDTLRRSEQALPPGHQLTQTIRHTLTSILGG
jgi:tetratricopeptide (TPR) repeat protein